jgi:hypothetical protein
MRTRTLIIIGILVVIAALAGFWWFFTQQGQEGEGSGQTTESSGGFFDFLNFGGSVPEDSGGSDLPGDIPDIVDQTPVISTEKLRMLVRGPVIGALATTTKNGFSARYVDRATGHISDALIETGEDIKVSNATIPRIQEAYMLPLGEEFILRYFDESYEIAETFGAKLVRNTTSTSTNTEYSTDGSFLDSNIESIATSPSDARVAYVVGGASGSTVYVSKSDGTVKSTALTSPIREWLIQWPKSDTLALTSKPSALSPGYLYFIPSKGGATEKALGAAFGLTTLVSPATTEVLFSGSDRNTFGTALYTINTRTQTEFPLKTLPEKCIWSKKVATQIFCAVPKSIPPALYPDAWYQGAVSFSDELWSVNTTDGTATLLASPTQSAAPRGIDAIQLSLNKDETVLLFINKKDGSLWVLDLRE